MDTYTFTSDNFILVKDPESKHPKLLYNAVPQRGSEAYNALREAESGKVKLYIKSMKTGVKREFKYYMLTSVGDDDNFLKILKFIDPKRTYATPVKVFLFYGFTPRTNVMIQAMFAIPDA